MKVAYVATSVLETGKYRFIIKGVESGSRPSMNNPRQHQDTFIFEVEHTDGEGEVHTLRLTTGQTYGNKSATFTKVMDAIQGRTWTREEIKSLDVRELIGQSFDAFIELTDSENEDEQYNKFISFSTPKSV